MLLKFSFSNYKCFEEKVTLEFNEKINVIQGTNATGKSSVIEAFQFMKHCIENSLFFSEENLKNPNKLKINFYKFNKNKNNSTEFEVEYMNENKLYKYGFKINDLEVLEEFLISEKTKIFERKKNKKLYLDSSIEKFRNNLKICLQQKNLLISLGALLNIEEFLKVKEWFSNVELIDCNKLPLEKNTTEENIFETEELKKSTIEFIKLVDETIVDIETEKKFDIEGNDIYKIFFIHKLGKTKFKIPILEETTGIKKIVHLFPKLITVLKNGGTCFVDDLDIKLDPLIMEKLLLIFKENNPKSSQLIFTTNNFSYKDMNFLNNNSLWNIEKKNGSSILKKSDNKESVNKKN